MITFNNGIISLVKVILTHFSGSYRPFFPTELQKSAVFNVVFFRYFSLEKTKATSNITLIANGPLHEREIMGQGTKGRILVFSGSEFPLVFLLFVLGSIRYTKAKTGSERKCHHRKTW